mgnify:CR=1 FL=1
MADVVNRIMRESVPYAEANAKAGLPQLTGSPRDVAWAEMVRHRVLSEIDEVKRHLEERAKEGPLDRKDRELASMMAATEDFPSQTSAAWWIEHRHYVGECKLAVGLSNPLVLEQFRKLRWG